MEVEILRVDDNQVIGRGDVYRYGVLQNRYKLYFEHGVLNPKAVKVGGVFVLTLDWLERMNKTGKVSIFEG